MCVLRWEFQEADGAHVRTHVWTAESILSFLLRLVNFSWPWSRAWGLYAASPGRLCRSAGLHVLGALKFYSFVAAQKCVTEHGANFSFHI